MTSTRTPDITADRSGCLSINEEYHGQRIFKRLGPVCQEHAEHRLLREIERLQWEAERRMHRVALFSDCANRFLAESKYKRTHATIAWHVAILLPHVGNREVRKVLR